MLKEYINIKLLMNKIKFLDFSFITRQSFEMIRKYIKVKKFLEKCSTKINYRDSYIIETYINLVKCNLTREKTKDGKIRFVVIT